jgi:3-hydroxybutyryl-CoA dehydrogenase
MPAQSIAVIGAGLMGHAIAQELATAGHPVQLVDVSVEALSRAMERIRQNLAMLTRFQLISEEAASQALARLQTTTDLERAAARCEVVIEAVSEDLAIKRRVFRDLDRAAPADAILASNTSSLLPDAIASATRRADRVLVAHFFNPPYLIPLVEVVRGSATSDRTVSSVLTLLREAGKAPVVVAKAVPGFLINRLQIALLREALSLVEKGVVSIEDVDIAVRNSIGRRLSVAGVFEVCDVTGLDVVEAAAANVIDQLDGSTKVSPLISGKVQRGQLGIKSGQGLYSWTPESAAQVQARIARALAEIRRWDQMQASSGP